MPKDFLSISQLSEVELDYLLNNTEKFKELFSRSVKKVPLLRGKNVLTLFAEPSTRTASSFEIAAKRLSADVSNFDVSNSSFSKGESVKDTIETLEAMRIDYLVIRHKASGMAKIISELTKACVINAGDGAHAHPTQALLDGFTLKSNLKTVASKKVLICGDVLHGRVAKSTARIFMKMGVEVAFLGPGSLMPKHDLGSIKCFNCYEDAWKWKPDVMYYLRVQSERQDNQFFPHSSEYHKLFGITQDRLKALEDSGTFLMHPGPVNRGVELCDDALEYEKCLINEQVENGIAARMAVLSWLTSPSSSL